MILRTVHMSFRPNMVDAFLELFAQHRESIASQPGYHSVQLIQSHDHPEQLSTVSVWDSQHDLDAYRKSVLFSQVWPATKSLFADPATAKSHRLLWAS